jgi:hypothetical protein
MSFLSAHTPPCVIWNEKAVFVSHVACEGLMTACACTRVDAMLTSKAVAVTRMPTMISVALDDRWDMSLLAALCCF